jgi:hypothetical protein
MGQKNKRPKKPRSGDNQEIIRTGEEIGSTVLKSQKRA